MARKRLYTAALLLSLCGTLGAQEHTPASQMEKLGRGLVVTPAQSGKGCFLSWRFLGTDTDATTFDILRNGQPIVTGQADRTNYTDASGLAGSLYQVVTKQGGVAVDTTAATTSWGSVCKRLALDRPDGGTTPSGEAYTYSPNDCSVGDVDGDGEYEIIVKWDPSNSKDNSQSGYTGNVYLDCYKLDGTKLWRIDLGVNIRAGAHYTQFLVYDFDGDGKAELICKTATGSKDGVGDYVNQAATDEAIKVADNAKDWRNSSGKVTGGQEYLTVFNGLTGKAIHTIFYNPNRATSYGGAPSWTFNWDDRSGKTDKDYGNRGERYLATVAYLAGADKNPSAVMTRGYYTYAFLWAVDFDGKELKQRWFHSAKSKTAYTVTDGDGTTTTYTAPKATRGSGSNTAYGNGNHNLSVADVDGDGCDEIIWGGCGIDQDGKLLYATGYGHGDAMHLSKHLPDREGLQVFTVHEGSPYGWDIHDAATGEILHSATGSTDNGRGLAADLDASTRGLEFWSANDRTIRSAVTGSAVSDKSVSVNFRTYWDGDLQDELFDGGKVDKWAKSGVSRVYPVSGKNFYEINSSSTCNGTKSTPNLLADILGDWREEIILWDGSDGAHLNIFTTNVPTDFLVPTLMHDHVYRLGVAWQNVAYNQPPHLGYYLPDRFKTEYVQLGEAGFTQDVALGDSIQPVKFAWKNCDFPDLVASVTPDGKQSGSAPNGFDFYAEIFDTPNYFVLTGKPSQLGAYKFVVKSGANKVDGTTRTDTITVNCVDASSIASVADGVGDAPCRVAIRSITDQVTLQVGQAFAGKVRVSLYNAAGVQVAGRTFNASNGSTLTLGGLAKLAQGVYVVKVETASSTHTAKLRKQ